MISALICDQLKFQKDIFENLLKKRKSLRKVARQSHYNHSPAGELEMQKKPLDGFQECHENALNDAAKCREEVSAETYQGGSF